MDLEAIANFTEITIALARIDTRKWQEKFDLKAFYFHRNDIECVLAEVEAKGVRFYMGIKEEDDKKCPEMLLVGVDEDGIDLIDTKGDNSRIYDFTLPCPRACDIISKLNWGIGPGYIGSDECSMPHEDRTPSTPDECNIAGFEVVLEDAEDAAENWQSEEDFNLISVGFHKDELLAIFTELSADAMRVYFALDATGQERIILVGVNDDGEDLTSDKLFINTIPLCTKDDVTACDTSSALYFSKEI